MSEHPTERADGLARTRMTLIERLKEWEDHESWDEFVAIYEKMIFGVSIRCGLTPEEAKDAVQETLVSVSKNIGKFKADPGFGSFRSWLMKLARWRISNQIRQRPKEDLARVHFNDAGARQDVSTATEEQIPDASENQLEALWQEEWMKNLQETAMTKLKRQVPARHYQILHALVIDGMPASKVARMLGTNSAMVHLVKHRLLSKFKRIIKDLQLHEGESLA